jgi:hypothetical protein
MSTRDYFSQGNEAMCEANHSPPYDVEVSNFFRTIYVLMLTLLRLQVEIKLQVREYPTPHECSPDIIQHYSLSTMCYMSYQSYPCCEYCNEQAFTIANYVKLSAS